MRTGAVLATATLLPAALWAHGFDERHDLPAPLSHFMAGAAAAVALSFVLAALFARRAPAMAGEGSLSERDSVRVPPAIHTGVRVASLLLSLVTVFAALAGTPDPTMNLAPTLVWVVWWVGLSLVVACIGDIWPLLDPWRTMFDVADAAARRLGRPDGISLEWHWPAALGVWPAVPLLLAWSWLEIVYPIAAVPHRLGVAAVLWTVLTLAGMVCFGRDRWQRHGDGFAIYFALLGRMAPADWRDGGRTVVPRAPGSGIVTQQDRGLPPGGVAFVLAMLSTVLFDGLHSSAAWPWFEGVLARLAPYGTVIGGNLSGTMGLLLVWLAFLAAYGLTCAIAARLARDASATSIARSFAPTLVPIAVGYNVAHNFSSLVEQGQNTLYLISDPFGWRWNLFGTAQLHTRSGLVDARLTWYVAISMIVLGHCIGVWLAHRVALREHPRPADAVRAAAPLVLLMLAYTAISLFVIAAPMVQYTPH